MSSTIAAGAILAALLARPVFHEDREHHELKRAQLAVVADALAVAVQAEPRWPWPREQLAAFAITIGDSESRFSLRIHEGQCKPWECDRGRARSPWQLQRGAVVSDEVFDALVGAGLQPTSVAAGAAVRAITRARWLCRSFEAHGGEQWIDRVFSAYGGRGCSGSLRDVGARRATYLRVLAQLRAWRPESS